MASPTVRNVATVQTTGASATLVITLPTYVAGDVLVACVAHSRFSSTPGVFSIPGFTSVEQDTGGWTVQGGSAVLARVADGSEGTTVTVTDANGAGSGLGAWVAVTASIQGASALPDVHDKAFSTANNQLVTTPTITSLVNNTIDIRFGTKQNTTASMTVPAGYTDNGTATETNANTRIKMASKAQATAASLGAQSFSVSEASNTDRDGGYSLTIPSAVTGVDAPFVAAATSVFAAALTHQGEVDAPFVGVTGAVYTPTLIGAGTATLLAPFVAATGVVYTPDVSRFTAPFVASTTVVYTPTIRRAGIGAQPVGVNIGFDDDAGENAPTWERIDA